MVEWRVARVKAAPAKPPDPGWGPVDDGNGLPGYGRRGAGGEVLYWRPLPRGVCGWQAES